MNSRTSSSAAELYERSVRVNAFGARAQQAVALRSHDVYYLHASANVQGDYTVLLCFILYIGAIFIGFQNMLALTFNFSLIAQYNTNVIRQVERLGERVKESTPVYFFVIHMCSRER